MMSLKKEFLWGGLITIAIIGLMLKVSLDYKAKKVLLEQSTTQVTQTIKQNSENRYGRDDDNEEYDDDDNYSQSTNSNNATNVSTTNSSTSTITAAEVAQHNSASDCWMVIDNKVLKVTNYLKVHPGGAGTMVPYCGKDGSQAYHDEKKHGSKANQLMSDFLIGILGMDISPDQVAKLDTVNN